MKLPPLFRQIETLITIVTNLYRHSYNISCLRYHYELIIATIRCQGKNGE